VTGFRAPGEFRAGDTVQQGPTYLVGNAEVECPAHAQAETNNPEDSMKNPRSMQSQVRDPNRYRSLNGAGRAAAQSGNRDKARFYCGRLVELADAGSGRPELRAAREYLGRY
jgi:hypothetical protein